MTKVSQENPIAIALHGGSGTILPSHLTPELEAAYRKSLQEALDFGWNCLAEGGSALDAVEIAAKSLEDCPLFNAGRGSVFTANEEHEMDAAVMCGRNRAAGAVAGVKTVRNPVSLAREVLKDGRYVFLAADGAEAFADSCDLERVDPKWFFTEERHDQLKAAREEAGMVMDHDGAQSTKFGTIGVVALDQKGDLAAATSTGGLTNKQFGRVGDSPVIGSGTYANNETCAVSCTGYGEEFIRSVVAHDVSARMEYLNEDLDTAARAVVFEKLPKINGIGGLISVDAKGHVSLPFNTEGMYRAWRTSAGDSGVEIFGE
ncbi:isoaspartyl peptidase/L-asparaginase family protein [Pelagicoccus mobilis]|uniref:Isoaspartyl peptidase n=1 Tax=Pelagicoccus mobilis TaxID=415221 RepID=A0A934VPY5_9BACT|nr:isoaspartyl peptidase/L-asparaginase [Pelagicoccus mobilis]MBK1875974.1 isoaspartyl peptidase/L-asparaginase [Pelagicoccus mobilis]